MAIRKCRLQKIVEGKDPENIYLETAADQVKMANGTDSVESSIASMLGKFDRKTTIIIGTTASNHTADTCDYLCDGTDDQIEFNAAVEKIKATGGIIYILLGEYHFTDKVNISTATSSNTITFAGQHSYGTVLYKDFMGDRPGASYINSDGIMANGAGAALFEISNSTVCFVNLRMVSSDQSKTDMYGGCLIRARMANTNLLVHRCWFVNGYPCAIAAVSARLIIEHSSFSAGGIYKDADGNKMQTGVIVKSGNGAAFTNYNCNSNGTTETDNGFLTNVHAEFDKILHNSFGTDVNTSIRTMYPAIIAHNNGWYGEIILDGVNHAHIVGNHLSGIKVRNHCKAAEIVGNAFTHTIAVSDSYATFVHGNWLGSGANSWTKVAVEISGKCFGTVVVENYVYSYNNYGATSIDAAITDTSTVVGGAGTTKQNNYLCHITGTSMTV